MRNEGQRQGLSGVYSAWGSLRKENKKKTKHITYSDDISIFHQSRQFLAFGSTAPELSCSFICCNINGSKGEFVGLEDSFHAGRRGDDVRGARCQGGVEVEGRVGHG